MTIIQFEPLRTGPRLIHVCPEFKRKMEEYYRAAKTNPSLANQLFREAQQIAQHYRASRNSGGQS